MRHIARRSVGARQRVHKLCRAHPFKIGDRALRFAVGNYTIDTSLVVTLAQIKADPAFADMLLVRVSRLSVGPATREQFRRILKLGGTKLRV